MLFKRRERLAGLSNRIGMIFSRIPLSPNQWTLLTLLPASLAAFFIVKENFIMASLFTAFAGFFDMVDGSVARFSGKETKKGAYLDTVVDRYVEGVVILALLFASLPQIIFPAYAWLFLYFLGGMMTTYAKAAAKETGLAPEGISGGILERAERLLLLLSGLLLAELGKIYLVYMLMLGAILANISAFQRIRAALKQSR